MPSDHMRMMGLIVTLAVLLGGALAAWAQGIDPQGRPVAEVRLEGLKEVPEQLVRNQIRLQAGQPFDQETVNQDIVRLTYLGRFSSVRARVEPQPEGALVVVYLLAEQPLLADVLFVGNKAIGDEELLTTVGLRPGDPLDSFLIDQAITRIEQAYEQRGYFVSDVTVDADLLEESAVALFHVREGPRLRIRELEFEGNQAFSSKELASKIESRAYFPIFRKGALNREQLTRDVAGLREFHQERGYLDVEVGRRIDLSPDQKDARVTFLIQEGPQYLVASIEVAGHEVFPADKILEVIALKVGDVYSADRLRRSQEAVQVLYGKLGYLDTQVRIERRFRAGAPQVDVAITVTEGRPALVGKTIVTGNEVTKDDVILQQLRGMEPARPFDRAGLALTERRLRESPLFSRAEVTVLGDPGDPLRDVLVEVEERNTGSLSFGAGISSDAGVVGAIDLVQRNFDIADVPESLGEFVTGKAFRGAGQYFSLSLQPGDEVSRYAVTFREPYLLDSDYFLDTDAFFFRRERQDYHEQRLGGQVGLGQRFGDVWSAQVSMRGEEIEINDIDADAPGDVFAVEGANTLTSLGLSMVRNTTDSRLMPTRGSRTSVGVEFVGAMGGDFDFPKLTANWRKYWTLDEDFWGRRTVLSTRVEVGYIFDDAPIFERFYAGGHRSFRGFAYRGVGPHDDDDPIGGHWLLLTGLEYSIPVYEEVLRWVFFTDMGTLENPVSVKDWRVAVGTGIRLQLPFLGQAPFAFDLAWPVTKQEEDDTRVFSFDVAVPF